MATPWSGQPDQAPSNQRSEGGWTSISTAITTAGFSSHPVWLTASRPWPSWRCGSWSTSITTPTTNSGWLGTIRPSAPIGAWLTRLFSTGTRRILVGM